MKAELINPFLQSTTSVFRDLLKVGLIRGKTEIRKTPRPSYEIGIFMQVEGAYKGLVVYSLNFETAVKIARHLVPDLSAEDAKSEYRDVIGEMGNMITGNAMQLMLKAGTEMDLSVPMVVDLRQRASDVRDMPTLTVFFYSQFGLLETNIALAS